tara:strand:- start:5182 stop:5397 length:216 start_codon:yes stop_codon:yes gene_type:complete
MTGIYGQFTMGRIKTRQMRLGRLNTLASALGQQGPYFSDLTMQNHKPLSIEATCKPEHSKFSESTGIDAED